MALSVVFSQELEIPKLCLTLNVDNSSAFKLLPVMKELNINVYGNIVREEVENGTILLTHELLIYKQISSPYL